MTVQTAIIAAPKAFTFKGRNNMVRTAALEGVALLAYEEGKSRADTIVRLKLALGAKPTVTELAAVRAEYIIGRAAQRLGDGDLPAKGLSVIDRITFARALVHQYAYPVKDGVAARKLKKDQLGRRTVSQHKVVRAGESAWSLILAELGFGTALTQTAKNGRAAAKRAPAMAGSTARGNASLTYSQLVKPDGPMTKEAGCGYIESMAATMLAFCNKNAGVVPAEYGLSVKRFQGAIAELAKARKAG